MTDKRILTAFKDSEWRADLLDRIIRSFVQGYAAVWLAMGADFDSLLSWEPAKGAAVAVVLSLLFSLGATQVGDPSKNNFKPNA
jgi:hypothetical protein